jgi:serine/threonine protein kinase
MKENEVHIAEAENYRIIGRLDEEGRNPYSKVFLGQDINTGEPATLKVTKRKGSYILDFLLMNDFPNVATVYSTKGIFFEDERQLLIIQSYIPGADIEHILKSPIVNTPDYKEIIRFYADITCQMLRGIEQIHEQGYYSGDLKPADFVREASSGEVVLVDLDTFAVKGARAIHSNPIYGSPEAYDPDNFPDFPIDHRADLFSIGAILKKMLAQVPIKESTALDHLNEIYIRTLARNPDDRYSSAGWMQSDISNLLNSL